ncbi:MAG: hypothetical protein WEB87_07000, partial [Bacteriovoracaceae bacterium]
ALRELKNSPEFSSIMAPVPLKIEAKFGQKVKTVCGDNLRDIEANNLAMSDLRGYAGFFERLRSSTAKPKMFDRYAASLRKMAKQEMEDPLEFARAKALEALRASEKLIEKRNFSFLKAIKENLHSNPIVIIGGIHAQHLEELLKEEEIEHEIVTPKGYSSQEQELYQLLRDKLKAPGPRAIVWYQVPEGFEPAKIPLSNLLEPEDIASKSEWRNLQKLMAQAGLDERILLSDYDQDGIRDFSAATSANTLVITAEDDDWDNDGVFNLADKSWGASNFAIKLNQGKVENQFHLQELDAKELFKKIESRGVKLIENSKNGFDLLLLKTISDTLSLADLDQEKLRFFRLASPKVKYGDQVFFAFNRSSLTVDIYIDELWEHFRRIHLKLYPDNTVAEVLKGYLLPLLYHSLGHELAHAMDLPVRELAKKDGWSFKTIKNNSKYLQAKRLSRKVIVDRLSQTTYKNKSLAWWEKERETHMKSSRGKNKFESFLIKRGVPSFYALKNPSEWIAEKISLCFLRAVYPDTAKKETAFQYEQLLGINPLAFDGALCSKHFTKN